MIMLVEGVKIIRRRIKKKLLIICIDEHKEPIENKRTDAKTTLRKTKAWEDVARKFNLKQKNGVRTTEQLKELYKTLKKNSKIELRKIGCRTTFDLQSTDSDDQIQGILDDTIMLCPNQAVVEIEADDSVYTANRPVANTETPESCKLLSPTSEKRPSTSEAATSEKFEIKRIDLEMKKMEMKNLAAVCKKKLEILNTELDIKKIETKIKELEYKAKLSQYKMIINE